MLAMLLFCCCAGKTEAENNNGMSKSSDCAQNGNCSKLSSSEEQKIKNLITTMWSQLPPGTNKIDSSLKFLTDSFSSVLSEGFNKYTNLDNDECQDNEDIISLAEVLFCWWGGQNPNPDGEFEEISVLKLSENEAKVKVDYKNWSDTETHILFLKKENGKWLLDNFDNVKEDIENICR